MKKNKLIKDTKSDKVFMFFLYFSLSAFFLAVLYPVIYVVSASFSDPRSIMAGKVWLLPVNPNLLGYRAVLSYNRIWSGFKNSFYYAGVGTLINVLITIMAAYPLSRKDFYGRNAITFMFAFTMWFSGGLIPSYIVVRNLNLLDTRWAVIIPNAMSVWNVVIARTYFQTRIPGELLESARLDGCNDFTFIIKIVLPLSKAIIAVVALFYAVSHWNSFFAAFIYLTNRNLYPIQLILREIVLMNQTGEVASGAALAEEEMRRYMSELLKYATIVVSSIPVIIMYPYAQKYFVNGIMIGAIKG
jgi:ABC-type glycerol-3-phosphate transport system permease component